MDVRAQEHCGRADGSPAAGAAAAGGATAHADATYQRQGSLLAEACNGLIPINARKKAKSATGKKAKSIERGLGCGRCRFNYKNGCDRCRAKKAAAAATVGPAAVRA